MQEREFNQNEINELKQLYVKKKEARAEYEKQVAAYNATKNLYYDAYQESFNKCIEIINRLSPEIKMNLGLAEFDNITPDTSREEIRRITNKISVALSDYIREELSK